MPRAFPRNELSRFSLCIQKERERELKNNRVLLVRCDAQETGVLVSISVDYDGETGRGYALSFPNA